MTQRLFLNFKFASMAMPHRRDAVDAAVRASTRRARAVCRDGVRATGQRHHDVHLRHADDGPGPVQRSTISVRIASKSEKKRATTSSDTHESPRRPGTAKTPRSTQVFGDQMMPFIYMMTVDNCVEIKFKLYFNLRCVVVGARRCSLHAIACTRETSWPSLSLSEGRGAEIATA